MFQGDWNKQNNKNIWELQRIKNNKVEAKLALLLAATGKSV